MLSSIEHMALLQQLPEVGQLLLVVGVTFALITLIYSTCRFQTMINLSGDELKTLQDRNNFFFVQVTRYLSRINRTASGFCLVIVQIKTDDSNQQESQTQVLKTLESLSRDDVDKVCLFREDCVAAIIDTDDEKASVVATRLTHDLSEQLTDLPSTCSLQAGACSFPTNGSSSQEVIDSALTALESAQEPSNLPLGIAVVESEEEETQDLDEDESEPVSKEEKNSSLDALTGVLNSTVIGSYMRKYLSDLRYKKQSASILCIGINRIENIISLHGEEAADTVIAGVSQVVQKITRESDLIGRYHRDDFLILAPCSLEQGEQIATRLREAIQKETFLFKGIRIKTSISAGISAYPNHGRAFRDLFRGAYSALEVIRDWDTSSCLVYDSKQHDKKVDYGNLT